MPRPTLQDESSSGCTHVPIFGGEMRTLNRLSLDRIDALGACVSGLCLVHCTAMPLLLAFSPTLAHLIPGDEWLHGVFACLVVGAGLPSFFMGFRRHRK